MNRSPYLKSEADAERDLPRKKPKPLVSAAAIQKWRGTLRRVRLTRNQIAVAYARYCRDVLSCRESPKKVRAAARHARIAERRARRAKQRSGK